MLIKASFQPFCSLELYHCLWQWSKCATGLRWFTSLLITFGFPSTAAKHFSSPAAAMAMSNPQSEKYGTQAMMEQTLRLASICSKEVEQFSYLAKSAHMPSLHEFICGYRHRMQRPRMNQRIGIRSLLALSAIGSNPYRLSSTASPFSKISLIRQPKDRWFRQSHVLDNVLVTYSCRITKWIHALR